MTEPLSRVSPDIEGPYAWRCCDTRYPHIYGIVTDRQLTLHAWREDGIEFQALYPRADAQPRRAAYEVARHIIGHLEGNCGLSFSDIKQSDWDFITNIIAAPSSPAMDWAWQDISTAPKDGTWVFIWETHGINTKFSPADVGRYYLGEWQNSDKTRLHNASHWKPLGPGPSMVSSTQGNTHD